MATKRKEIVRLLLEGMSQRNICCAMHCSKRDVSAAARMVKVTGINKEVCNVESFFPLGKAS
jgi:DNA-binding CsgD family transcriptional regulator